MRYFDLHCDTITRCATEKTELYKNDFHISLNAAKSFSPWAQVFAIWLPDDIRGNEAVCRFENVYQTFVHELKKNEDTISFCLSGEDMVKAVNGGKNAAFLSIEGGAALAGSIERLYDAHSKGVKLMTLTWNGACELGDGCMKPEAGGLTPFGREVVREMTRLKMIIDVSHLSEQGFYDAAQETDAPLVASHSNSKAVCPHPRNLSDEQIKEIIRRGGLIGLNLYPPFICAEGSARLLDIIPHARHILSLGGENTLAVGADFDGADMPDDVKGIGDMTELYNMLKEINKETSDRIFYDNAYKFFLKL